jgi:hypothetical protein
MRTAEQLAAEVKRDYPNDTYRPNGILRVRSYVTFLSFDELGAAKHAVYTNALAFAETIKEAGWQEVEVHAAEPEILYGGGLKVEALISIRGKFDWRDNSDYDPFDKKVMKPIRKAQRKKKTP